MSRSAAWDHEAEFVVVGSGAGGATVGLELTRAGRDVVMLEEGSWYRREHFRADMYTALQHLWRDFGGQTNVGRSVFPVSQGRCVGGSTVINAAIMHRLPQSTWEEWAEDRGIREHLPWKALVEVGERIERELGVQTNIEDLMPDLPMTAALERLGWRYQAMTRSAPGCENRRRCLIGCPSGEKLSLERSFVPSAIEAGARLLTECRVRKVVIESGRAVGVELDHSEPGASGAGTRRVRVRAHKAVVLCAGTVHTPLLLHASGIRNPHLGRHFQCHIGTSVIGELDRPILEVEGPALGYEVLEFSGIKLNSLQITPMEIAAANIPLVGGELVDLIKRFDQLIMWNNSTASTAEGRVAPSILGWPRIQMTPLATDLERVRECVLRTAEIFFEVGARLVYPGVAGISRVLSSPDDLSKIREAPLDPRSYALDVSHIFGTCRMGSDPNRSVVGPRFDVHGCTGLHVADASIFPTNLGVNPQLSIMTLAGRAAQLIAT